MDVSRTANGREKNTSFFCLFRLASLKNFFGKGMCFLLFSPDPVFSSLLRLCRMITFLDENLEKEREDIFMDTGNG